MPRHSFVQMSKLTNLKGRISYISSHARQENLYAVYETTERKFWSDLVKCNQEEFKKSGTDGTCIEARELIIALPESLVEYEPDMLLKSFVEHFKQQYGVEAIGALHHNKRKTNYHIHLIFSERKLLEEPIEKVATRNMFYNEIGKHVRTKKEILNQDGQLKNGCKIVSKGDVYEKQIFTTKNAEFKSEMFLYEIKTTFTNLINLYVKDEKEQLQVFDKSGVYLPMKKIGKRNPKSEQIESDNQLRQKWNQTVDRALLGGVSEAHVMKIKQMEISAKVNDSVKNHGKCPQLFSSILEVAITVLQILVYNVLNAIHLQCKNGEPMNHLPNEQECGEERAKTPLQKSELAEKYTRLEKVFKKLNNQNLAIYQKEQEMMDSKRELENLKGIFKGKQRKVLQTTVEELSSQISNMKQSLSNMVQDYGYKNMKAFLKDYNAAKEGYGDYQRAVIEWRSSATKKSEPISILERLEISKKRIRETDNKKKQVGSRSRNRDAR